MFKNAVRTAVLLVLASLFGIAQTAQPAPPVYLACRVVEIHTDAQLKVAVILFHQADPSQRAELAQMLRDHSDEAVEIQNSQGGWQLAWMVRMKSCFGRGLLIMPTPAPVSEHSQFLLRIPNGSSMPQH